MRVFVTGATGFIGTQVTKDLLQAGHQVLGMARSDEGAKAVLAAGAQVHRGDLKDLDSLRSGASQSDGVIHLGFIHDFSNFVENCEIDRRAIETIGTELGGSNRPFVVTSGTGVGATSGALRTEDDIPTPQTTGIPRIASEQAAIKLMDRGVRVSVVRLPQVHDTRKFGLISYMMAVARDKGFAAYVGEGKNRWAACHLLDAAKLYKLAFEKAAPRAFYHSVGEEGVSLREMAEAIGRRMKLPVKSVTAEEAPAYFGWIAMFAGLDMPASSAKTQQWLNWHPTHRGIIPDLNEAEVTEAVARA